MKSYQNFPSISEGDVTLCWSFSLSELRKDNYGRKVIHYADSSWIATIYGLGRKLIQNKELGERLSSEDKYGCYLSAIGEILAPHFPRATKITGLEAEEYFLKVMGELLSTDISLSREVFFGFNNDLWLTEGRSFFKSRFGLDKTLTLPITKEEISSSCSPWYKIFQDLEMLKDVLCLFGTAMSKDDPLHHLWLTTHTLAGFSRNADNVLTELINGIKDDLLVEIPADIKLCRMVRLMYINYLNPDVIDTLIRNWNFIIPSYALDLNYVIQNLKEDILSGI